MNKKILKSYSKVNLFLNVGKKNKKNKLHDIQSLVSLISIHDKIQIKKISGSFDKIKFSGKFSKSVDKKNNSVIKCLSLLRKLEIVDKNQYFNVIIKKNIPVFSGMGGGSSNAATIVKYLNNKKITKKKIFYISKFLGSDFRLFFGSKQLFQQNINQIQDLKKKFNFYLIIVFPFLKSSTKIVYSKVKIFKKIKYSSFYINKSKLKIIENLKNEKNFLQKIVVRKYPVIQKVLYELENTKKCEFSRVTGSGSACFGLFLTKKSAVLGLKKIKKKFPKFWCVIGKTI